jgi:hypothetical protein
MHRQRHRHTSARNLAKALKTIEQARRGNRPYAAKDIDVVALRGRMGMSQELLNVIAHDPEAVLRALP